MTKPMYCPMSFANEGSFRNGAQECTPDCAWAKFSLDGKNYFCAIPQIPGGGICNYRPLEDEE